MPSPLTIQPSSKDAFALEQNPTTAYGSYTFLETKAAASGYAGRIFIEFPIVWGTDIPAEAIITNASLMLYYYSYADSDPVGRTINAYRLLRLDWVETQATWNIYKTGSNWTLGGAGSDGNDHTTTNGASQSVPASYGWMTWDITEQVKTAQSGSINIACLLKDSSEVSGTAYTPRWYSNNESAQTTLRPKLVVTYSTGETKQSSDSGGGTEAVALRELDVIDTGNGLEESLGTAAILTGDAGAGSEMGGLLKGLFSQDEGSGLDNIKILTTKSGSDLRLHSHHGQVGIPHKEVKL